ncbi:MAG TPA: alpha/beta hydrolase [Beijerinckiaceae bacterium]|nr:alpha/beta hydrolase [Beijerinckiaceae bacterium]
MTSMPDDIRKAIPPLGQNAAPDNASTIRKLYAPLLEGLMKGVEMKLDIPYGDHERQKLDVYWKAGGSGKPVFVYIPGGGFVGGDKRSDPVFYGNVGGCVAREGMVGVVANYRLAPEAKWPLAAKDVESAVKWVKEHAAEFGGDPNKIVIMGHSAGAAHVATFLFDPDINGGDIVAGGMLSSGPYEVRKDESRDNVLAYFGSDTGQFDRRSPLNYVAKSKVPVAVSIAEYDPLHLITPGYDMARALTLRDGKGPRVRCFDGHNHFSTVASMGSRDDDFAKVAIEFIRTCTGG